jgi:hypothetical protein
MEEGPEAGERFVLRPRTHGRGLRFGVCLAAAVAIASLHGAAGASVTATEQGAPVFVDVDVVPERARASVVSVPRGIICRPACISRFARGAQVLLVAGSDSSWRFAGWSGECVGRSVTCLVIAEEDVNVSARFVRSTGQDVSGAAKDRHTLYVTGPSPRKGGKVESSPPGISCPPKCDQRYRKGTKVKLRAKPPRGRRGASWYGNAACGGNTCDVRMESDAHVAVVFGKSG